ncbi:DUF4097 family beta strand repeat-containing protein [Sphaerisporangium aureirubrum]|uniref:DUF4097 domain-containing protein n=1 Tax=Sphaerisporangium aureirubrum TaxID=1544736 RepID=A0ABW1NQQ2_9ACTN
MPEFDTPEPISVTIEFDVGTARVTASRRTDTVVEVLPMNPDEDADVRAAQQTKVGYAGGKLLVKGPRKRSLFGRSGSIDVRVELPAGSDVQGAAPLGDFTCEGPLGDCRLSASVGDIHVTEAASVDLRTDHGGIRVDRASGDAEVTGAGRLEVGEVGGTATVKNVNGETTIGEVGGDLRARASNGRISIGVAHAGVDARSANGGILVGEVSRGQVTLQTGIGDLEIGIRESSAAWLDVKTRLGKVRNSLTPSEGPETSGTTIEVRAHTALGDIIIRRP